MHEPTQDISWFNKKNYKIVPTSKASPYLAVLLCVCVCVEGGGGLLCFSTSPPMVHKYVAHDTLIASSTFSSSFFSPSFSFTL